MCVCDRETPEECSQCCCISCEQEKDSQRQEVSPWREEVFASIRPLSARWGRKAGGGSEGRRQSKIEPFKEDEREWLSVLCVWDVA